MPPFDAFDTAADAYATLAHELGHWSGHPSRLNRSFGVRFGDHAYAAEELVAELSAAFTCALVGIDTVARTDHAAYLAHWCRLLRQQPAVLWSIAAKAQAATDLLARYQPGEAQR
jgi:antirestriction protein ArdC